MRKKVIFSMGLTGVLAFSTALSALAAPFDAEYYAQQNPDVAAVVGNDPAMLELHYNTYGMNEGRAANATDAPLGRAASFEEFDAEYYALQYPDVAAVFGNDPMSLYTHYLAVGRAEGRAPSASAAAAASHSGSGSGSEDNPYARFASSGSGSSHHSHSSSKSSSDEADEDEVPESESSLDYKEKLSALEMEAYSSDDEEWWHADTITMSGSSRVSLAVSSVFSSESWGHPDAGVPKIYEWHFSGDTDAFITESEEKDATVKINGTITENKTLYVYCTLTYRDKTVQSQNVTITAVPESEEANENDTALTEETATDVVDTNISENEDGAETETLTSESADGNEEVSEEEETTEDISATEETVAVNAVIAEAASDSEEEAVEESEAEAKVNEEAAEEGSEAGGSASETAEEETKAEENQEESEDEPEIEENEQEEATE